MAKAAIDTWKSGMLPRNKRATMIADAEAPFAPKGCPFQAWSLGALLRLDRVVLAESKSTPRVRRGAPQAV